MTVTFSIGCRDEAGLPNLEIMDRLQEAYDSLNKPIILWVYSSSGGGIP